MISTRPYRMNELFRSMDDVLLSVLERIRHEGAIEIPRGLRTREITALSFTLADPRARKIGNPARKWSETYAVGELCWHLSASDRLDGISHYSSFWKSLSFDGRSIAGSCYGKRIFETRDHLSPWDATVKLLSEDPSSRRAVLYLAPQRYPTANDLDIPCIATVQFLVRDGKLDCYVGMRSCDAVYGLCYDVYFVTMLQEILSLRLHVELGIYHQTTTSMHYYDRHAGLVQRILNDEKSNVAPMPPMSDLDGIEGMLAIERLTRECPTTDPLPILRTLSPYWYSLAMVLVTNAARRSSADPEAILIDSLRRTTPRLPPS